MKKRKLSVIIPVNNEANFLAAIIEKVLNADTLGLEKEIIIVDDHSRDDSPDIIKKLAEKNNIIKYFLKEKNGGKCSALR